MFLEYDFYSLISFLQLQFFFNLSAFVKQITNGISFTAQYSINSISIF